jgi:hypothetical protein
VSLERASAWVREKLGRELGGVVTSCLADSATEDVLLNSDGRGCGLRRLPTLVGRRDVLHPSSECVEERP